MPLVELVASSGLGSLVGMRHALEPDHLAAVSTLVSSQRSGLRAAWLGCCWGIGHTAALFGVGTAVVLLRTELPIVMIELFELTVAAMLIALGVRAIAQAVHQGQAGPMHVHRHGPVVHRHAATPAHVHLGAWTLARRPLLIGLVHGLAGSGALTALVLTTLPSTAARLTYMALFGIGSTVGMAALSGALGWPLARLSAHRSVARGVSLTVGLLSAGIGVAWGLPLIAAIF